MVVRFCTLILFYSSLFSAAKISVDVDRRIISKGETFSFIITVTNADSNPEIKLPEIENLKVVDGPSISNQSSIKIINGKRSSSKKVIYTWILAPLQTGKIIIPSFQIAIANQKLVTQPIDISVKKRIKDTRFFIEAELNNNTPFVGEQITLTYTLYTQVSITSFSETMPSYIGFWTEDIFSPKNLKLSNNKVQKNGRTYFSATIKKIALFPTQSGKLNIEPLYAEIGVRDNKRSSNNFSLFFEPPSQQYVISTDQIPLDIIPLPIRTNENNSGIVGNWDIKSFIDTNQVNQNEAITFKVVITGTGNIDAIPKPNISFPNGLEVFDPKISLVENPLRDLLGGEKIFEWVIIPRSSGIIEIPKIFFDYFNPNKKVWITKSTSNYKLNVSPIKDEILSVGFSKEEITLIGKDIRFVDESKPNFRKNKNSIFTSSYLLLIFSFIFFIIPRLYNFIGSRQLFFIESYKKQSAYKISSSILNNNQNSKDLYTSAYKSIIKYVNLKTGNKKVEYSINELIKKIKEHTQNIDIELVEVTLKEIEAARFSPILYDETKVDIDKIKILLKEIDNEWK